ncbi:serine/threonine-protein kinase [Scrofimicrobium canadense]|nr:serine/threonine-protein kinase [Scrofimicrobium canadense]
MTTGSRLGGRYQLLTLIATGGMGEVWKARDSVTGTLVAIKVLRPELSGEEISLSRLRVEAKNAMVARHPNIAAVLDSGQENGQGWIVMELVDGRPLTDYLREGGRLSAQQLLPILVQTAYALDTAARAGVVHRDIKPANILIREDGLVKLTDFGVSLADGQANLTAAGMVMGTAQYLAPEQALGKTATSVGDLYSLGVVAYEALAGYRPYTGKTQVDIAFAHVNDELPPLPDDVPAPLAAVVAGLLDKDPANRPQTGAALVRHLRAVADGLGIDVNARPLGDPQRPVVAEPSEIVQIERPEPEIVPAPMPTVNEVPKEGLEAAPVFPKVIPPVRHQVKKHLPDHSGVQWQPVSATPPPVKEVYTPSENEATPQEEQSPWGLWVIIGLVVLTVALIVVAMIRNAHDEGSGDSASALTKEVSAWQMPTTVA